MVCEIAEENHRFIELMRPKVEMLTRWAQQPDAMRETMKSFQGLLEELRKKYPDDPQTALESLLDDILTTVGKTKQSPAGDGLNAASEE